MVGVLRGVVLLVAVLAGVHHLVLEQLVELVESSCQQRTDERSNPINPMIGVELSYGARCETASGVKRPTSVVDGYKLGDEEREADTEGSDEGSSVLLGCEHEDGEDQLRGADGFDKDTLGFGGAYCEGRADVKDGREEHRDDVGGECTSCYLCDELKDGTEERDLA